ncbi:MAG: amidohydrolase family protein [Chitinophagaceae bacterium]
MSYRKLRATQLFTGYQLFDNSHVLILKEEGIIEAILPVDEAGPDIEQFEGILTPGFINCHCHLELSHMKDLVPENTGMIDFILSILKQRHSSEELIFSAIEKAESEMVLNGIVAVGDICNTTTTLLQKKKGNLFYHNFLEVSGFSPSIAEERFNTGLSNFNAFAQQYAIPVESNSMVPHAPYSVSPLLFNKLVNFPGNNLLTMHNQECIDEEELLMNKKGDFLRLYRELGIDLSFFEPSGLSSLQNILPYFKKNQTLILVHNVTTSKDDINVLASLDSSLKIPQVYFCLCVNANLYIGNPLPNVDLLLQSNCPIVLGTDSLASNHQLSILEEMKTLQYHFPKIELKQLLQWATINGAKALQLDEMLGSFEKGKKPGVLQIRNVSGNKIETNSIVQRII